MTSTKNHQENRGRVEYLTISEDQAGQRIDNFLINHLKGVPKSHIYKLVRKGEVRVNKKRIDSFYRLLEGDSVRLPPLFLQQKGSITPPSKETSALLKERILYEDKHFLIINKPSGMSVHSGNTVRVGVIEALRHLYPQYVNLELAHRLDSETSGCLILVKKKRVLREMHELLRAGKVNKIYWALTKGIWKDAEIRVDLPLQKTFRKGGKHVVSVNHSGKSSQTIFNPIKIFREASLVEVKLLTGRTHQIRVHAQYQNHPIAGDDRYGDSEFNKVVQQHGLKRMFLHARSIDFVLPSSNQRIRVVAPLDAELEKALKSFAEGTK